MVIYIKFSWVALTAILAIASAGYNFGLNNSYTCHCINDEKCDIVTGGCSNGCLKGWGGPSCQQENIALGSDHVNQSETFISYGPELAVDGYTNTDGYRHPCSDTSYSSWAWWFIDLQQQFPIRYIKTFYNNVAVHTFKGFSVHVDDELCFQHTDPLDPPDEYLIECEKTITGRYVNISNNKPDDHLNFINLCEVEIYVCAHGTYGSDCNKFCHCSNDDHCDVKTGQCSNGCQIGWYSDNCNTSCSSVNKYGFGCQKSCTSRGCSSSSTCDQVNGECINGCISGYQGIDCSQVDDLVCTDNSTITVLEALGGSCFNISGVCNGSVGLRLEYIIPSFIVTTLENGDIQICGNASAPPLEVGVSQIQATVTDGFNTLNITISLIVTAVNQYPPVFNNLPDEFTVAIPEDMSIGSEVFTFTVTDDDDDFGMFKVTAKMEDLDFGTFKVSDDKITLIEKLNASSKSSYTIFLTATDTGGLSDNLTVVIDVQDVNEPPVCIDQATFNISALLEDGDVGQLPCYDYDVNPEFTQIRYYLIQPLSISVPFTMDQDGKLKVTGSLLELQETLTFTVEASTGDKTTSISVTIYLSLDDPVCTDNYTITVLETVGDSCFNIRGICNGSEGLRLEYGIPNFIVTTLENGDIQICGNTSAGPLEVGVFQIKATVTDGFNTLNITISLTVTAVNKYPPAFNNLPDKLTVEIPEDMSIGSEVFTFTVTDDDDGDFGIFRVSAKMKGLESGTFEVSDDKITLLKKLNASSKSSYIISLTATDTGRLSDNLTVVIDVQDVNEPPVCIDQASFNISALLEEIEVGHLPCHDYDVNPEFTQIQYKLIQPPSMSVPFTVDRGGNLKATGNLREIPEILRFTVEASTRDQTTSISVTVYLSLVAPVCMYTRTITVAKNLGGSCLNTSAICSGSAEPRLEYTIPNFIVTTLENGDIQICGNTSAPPLELGTSQIQATVTYGFNTRKITISLTVTAVNEYPPVFNNLPDEFTVEIPEDIPIGSEVFPFTVTDDDDDDGFGMFRVTAKMEDLESRTFQVSDDKITLLEKLNASSKSSYTILLKATDIGGLSDDLTVVIDVQDVNEPPVCIDQATFNISALLEDSKVGQLPCYDYDINPEFTQIQYNLIQPSMSVPFTADQDGKLKATGSLLEIPETLTFTVEASTGDQTTSISVTIYLSPKVLISFKVTNRDWDHRMVNNQSQVYKHLKLEIEENFMVALSYDRRLQGVYIINIRPENHVMSGNVMMDGIMFVNESGAVDDTSRIFVDHINYTGSLGNLTVQDGVVYQEDQYMSSSMLTLRKGDPDRLLEGTSVEYACKFRLVTIKRVTKPLVKWYLDEAALTNTSRIKMKNSIDDDDRFGYQYIIHFDKAKPSHEGLLKCMVQSSTNPAINTSTTERVKIISKPVVTLWPLSAFLKDGESVTLNCSSESSSVTYSWFDAITKSEIVPARNSDVYTITVLDKDVQVYCEGANLAGTTPSPTATVHYTSFTAESLTCINSTDARDTTWPPVKAGAEVKLPCGEEYSGGFAQRNCSESGDWSLPDYSNCKRLKLTILKRGTDDVKEGKLVTTPEKTLETLANLTSDGKQFAAGDVEVSVQILMDVVDITGDNTNVVIGKPELKNFAESASNILDADGEEWITLAEQGKSGIAVMMNTVDAMAKLCSSRLQDKEPVTASTDKMMIEIGKSSLSENIEFPRATETAYPKWLKASANKVFLGKDTLANAYKDNKDVRYNAVFYNDVSKMVEGGIIKPGETADSKKNKTVDINSKILAVSIHPPPEKLNPPIKLSFQHLSNDYPSTSCVFLDLKPPYDKRGRWSTEGCKTESTSDPNVTICKCDHLTNFAILMSPGITPTKYKEALSIISAVGCAISMFCLMLTIVVYIYFWRYVKSDKAIILMNLCGTLIIAYVIFLAGVNRTDAKALCQTVAVFLHFFFLVVFFLMLAEGVQVLISVVALAMKSRLKLILTASWGIPVIIVVVSMAVTQLDGYGNNDYCWLSLESGLLWAFVGPALAVILVNAIIMVKVLTVMFSTTTMVTKSMKEKGRTGIKALCVLLPIIGLTWVFGVFSVNGYAVIFQYLFAIFNSLQGLFIFIFHCLLNRQVKEGLKIRRKRYRAKSIDTGTGTKSFTQSNQTRSTIENDKVTSAVDEKASPAPEDDSQVQQI